MNMLIQFLINYLSVQISKVAFTHFRSFPFNFFYFIVGQNETNQTSADGELLKVITVTTTAAVNNAPMAMSINVSREYEPPSTSKVLCNTWHPRNFKEFSQRPSAPVKFVGSKQREPLPIKVSYNLKKLYINTEILFRFLLMMKLNYILV